jgi:phosphoglycolate phosphatase-like HAD superfamily hydrolase
MKRLAWLWVAWVWLCLEVCGLSQGPLLASWNDSETKRGLIRFVERTTTAGSPDFVPANERIAVFDNDGTLWSEQPMYVQLAFAIDRVKALTPNHPEWKTQMPFSAVLNGDLKSLATIGERGLIELVMATHAGTTTDEFNGIVKEWIATAKHPVYKRPYTECVYQPILELLQYLRAHEFKTFIVSSGGIEFMRPWVEEVYGIPPEQVIGSSIKVKYELRDGKPVLVRLPEIDFIDDKAGKPVGIHQKIGRRPILAVGNSDGDYEMLEYITAGEGLRMGILVHHTDGEREVAYDRASPFGRLDKGLANAAGLGWQIIDMRNDWKQVFPAKR